MVKKESWKEFRESGLLRFVNMFLHIFGWCLMFDIDDDGNIQGVYPARCDFDGFCENEEAAYLKLRKYMNTDKFFNDNNKRGA